MNKEKIRKFNLFLVDFYKKNKRDLEWRKNITSYKIVVSEIMLQQTQVGRVNEKFPQFIKQFPDFKSLASAPLSKVLLQWQGMGYNRRGKYLREIAQLVTEKYDGILPSDPVTLITFPGIGRATAGSICAFAFNKPALFIETNIRRVFIHYFFENVDQVDDKEIISIIAKAINKKDPRDWYYALMDYGSYLSKEIINPNKKSKHYVVQSKFEGSKRQIRGKILKLLLQKKITREELIISIEDERLDEVIKELISEKIIIEQKGFFTIQ